MYISGVKCPNCPNVKILHKIDIFTSETIKKPQHTKNYVFYIYSILMKQK